MTAATAACALVAVLTGCAARVDASNGAVDAAAEVKDGDASDSDAAHPSGYYSVCSGAPCRGTCTADGGCECEGIRGGCPEPSVCCGFSYACTAKCPWSSP